MNIHYLQHVPFEGIGSMEPYFISRGDQINSTRLFINESFPNLDDFEFLIIMGGPMGVYDESKYHWLAGEKSFIRDAVKAGKKIIGICLGAQLIAEVMGARVYKNDYREIGWFPLEIAEEIEDNVLAGVLPEGLEVFHWHGDTFDIPDAGILLASSKACRNQGFIIDNRIIGLQFHLETTPESAGLLIENCADELDDSEYVQSETEIMSNEQKFSNINKVMVNLIEKLIMQ